MPVWACVNGNLLAKWMPPEIAQEVTIFGDNDKSFTGQAKAYQLANRLELQYKRKVSVILPPNPDTDWADVWDEKRRLITTAAPQLRVVK
jgi:putative DNA primase/helicase